MDKQKIQSSIHAQRRFFAGGQPKNISFRREALIKLKNMIKQYEPTIMDALWKDLHKSQFESYATEIGLALKEIDFHLCHLRRWTKTVRKPTLYVLFPSRSRVMQQPYGVVLIMAPWNYPFNLLMTPLIAAISAGNCAVLKPSPYTAAMSALFEKMISETFPPEYITVIQGHREVNQELLEQRFDYIFFTGGAQFGRIVMKSAAENLTPVTLELGGKSPCIVDKDANLQKAARRIVWGKFLNAGQTCIAPDYLFVHRDIKPALLEKIKAEIIRQFGNNPYESPDYPRIVNDKAFDRLNGYLQDSHIICGGEIRKKERYIAPTVLDKVTVDSHIMQEEIFGPILPVMDFDTLNEVIDFIISREKPLALYYFTRNMRKAKKLLQQTSAGNGCINDVVIQFVNNRIPFGGVGNSGMGSYHGKYSFETFSRQRSVIISPTWFDIPIKFAPYKQKLKLLRKLF
ncbi:MAG: aldehyde dehydrogenase [Candidatus Marinimicrobia bacterium]|nr:aldehyde dehydrogenase [Candidatus Neomarinimicrobiota bacterium]